MINYVLVTLQMPVTSSLIRSILRIACSLLYDMHTSKLRSAVGNADISVIAASRGDHIMSYYL